MPEWRSQDLWIEAAPPIPSQETSLAWETEVRNYNLILILTQSFALFTLFLMVGFVKLSLSYPG